jgi:hypothetical protein
MGASNFMKFFFDWTSGSLTTQQELMNFSRETISNKNFYFSGTMTQKM